jgi:hypothetical protein
MFLKSDVNLKLMSSASIISLVLKIVLPENALLIMPANDNASKWRWDYNLLSIKNSWLSPTPLSCPLHSNHLL